jgi:hypothetical protein
MAEARHENFVNQVNKTGGASMNVKSGKLVQPGSKGFMVGGSGVPTARVPEAEFGPEHVAAYEDQIQKHTKNWGSMHVGAWKDDGHVEMDASQKFGRRKEAVRKGKARNEKAIWDNKSMKEVDTGGSGTGW